MTAGLVAAITALAFSPDGATLYSSAYKEVLVWNVSSGQLARRIGGLNGRVRGLAVSPDGRTLAVADGVPGRSGAVSLIALESGARTVLVNTTDEMLTVAFHPAGKQLAAGGADNVVRVFDIATAQSAAKMEDHSGWITAVAYNDDGKLLASGSQDGTVRIWDTGTYKEILRLPQTPGDAVTGLAFSPDKEQLAFSVGGVTEHALRMWRVANAFQEMNARPGQRNAMMQTRLFDTGACLPLGVAFAKMQTRVSPVAACADNSVTVVGPNGGVTAKLAGHKDWVYTVAANKDGSLVASGSADGTIRFWNAQGRLAATLTPESAR